MKPLLLAAVGLAGCVSVPTFEDTARVLTPDTIYAEKGMGDFIGGNDSYERDDLVIGASWNLMPRQVRVIPEDVEPHWYEPEPPEHPVSLTVTEDGSLFVPAGLLGILASLLGGTAWIRRKRDKATETDSTL